MRRVGKFCRSKKAEFQAANNPLMEGKKEKGSFKVVLLLHEVKKKVKILDFARHCRSMVCRSTLGKVERMSEKWKEQQRSNYNFATAKKLMDVLPLFSSSRKLRRISLKKNLRALKLEIDCSLYHSEANCLFLGHYN